MKQYQLYLDSNTISLLDKLEKTANIPVSKLLQSQIKQFAHELARTFSRKEKSKTPTVDNMIGTINIKSQGKTNYATRHDNIYLRD